jgi:hypothetical protein
MWNDEAKALGQKRLDLTGQPLLWTPLSTFNRFLCLELEQQDCGDFGQCQSEFHIFQPELILRYCRHLYQRLDLKTRDLSFCIYSLHDFLSRNWDQPMGMRLVEAKALLECMNINLNELRRLRLLHKNLSAESHGFAASQIGPPNPLGDLEELDGQLHLFTPEFPVVDEQETDTWRVVSKHVKACRVLLRGEDSQHEISLPISKKVMNHLKRGDLLPLTVAEAWDGQKFILSAGMPPF